MSQRFEIKFWKRREALQRDITKILIIILLLIILNLYFRNIYMDKSVFLHLIKCSFQKIKNKMHFSNFKLFIEYFSNYP